MAPGELCHWCSPLERWQVTHDGSNAKCTACCTFVCAAGNLLRPYSCPEQQRSSTWSQHKAEPAHAALNHPSIAQTGCPTRQQQLCPPQFCSGLSSGKASMPQDIYGFPTSLLLFHSILLHSHWTPSEECTSFCCTHIVHHPRNTPHSAALTLYTI